MTSLRILLAVGLLAFLVALPAAAAVPTPQEIIELVQSTKGDGLPQVCRTPDGGIQIQPGGCMGGPDPCALWNDLAGQGIDVPYIKGVKPAHCG